MSNYKQHYLGFGCINKVRPFSKILFNIILHYLYKPESPGNNGVFCYKYGVNGTFATFTTRLNCG